MENLLDDKNRVIAMNLPRKLVFGDHCIRQFTQYFANLPVSRVMIIADSNIRSYITDLSDACQSAGKTCFTDYSVVSEPTINDFEKLLTEAESQKIDAVIGMGGGSVLDVAKLVAVMSYSSQPLDEAFGNGNIKERMVFLACLPSTAGTGSEVSPNAILLDERDNKKKAVISPFLVPDASFIDPLLTYSVPPSVTASTGLDALTHCIEAYANVHANQLINLFALEGIRLIGNHLKRACENGADAEARRNVALGSMHGGLCLGPVNTAAVHAMAYPLGSMFGIPHGVSNAILLPHVLDFNLPAAVKSYAQIALALGVAYKEPEIDMASEGIRVIEKLVQQLGIKSKLSAYNSNITKNDIPLMVESAMSVSRLLKNNVRQLTAEDMQTIYHKLF